MKTDTKIYLAQFVGRQVGAIGEFYPIKAVCVGADEESAWLSLYDRFEHISRRGIKDVSDYATCPTTDGKDLEIFNAAKGAL